MNAFVPLLALGIAVAAFAGPALADRQPTPEERTRIEAKLNELGFTAWEEIELEDDNSAWEVEDARAADGREYELKLHPESLEVLRQELD